MKRALILLAACGGAAPLPAPSTRPSAPTPDAVQAVHLVPDPVHAPKLLDIDWDHVQVASDADALALWQRIAPTGDDWERRLAEIPTDRPVARQLAFAMLRGGNFACHATVLHTHNCTGVAPDMPPPEATAGLDDPCLRRLLALWSFDQLESTDAPALMDPLRAIAALPPPESQLVVAAIREVPEVDQDNRLALIGLAQDAGQRDVVDGEVGRLDEAHLITAATNLHTPGALEVLSADGHRATYLHAITDDKLPDASRIQALSDIVGSTVGLGPDGKAALATAAASPSCPVAARAARSLDDAGDHRFVPVHPHAKTPQQMVRALCLLASYEQTQHADEASMWPNYVSARGVEHVTVTYDPLSEVDTDGDGDPHTNRTVEIEKRHDALLPEGDDMVRAMRHCTIDKETATCLADNHAFRFTFRRESGEYVVASVEVAEQPGCMDK